MTVRRTKGKKPDNIIVQNIQVHNASHKTQDIQNWKNAIRAFENINCPVRSSLYDLYEDITLDGQIEATWGKRRDAVLNRELVYLVDGTEDENITRLLNSPDMRLVISHMLDSVAWGYTLIQFNAITWDDDQECYKIDFDLIPRKHVHPERGFECVSIQQGTPTKDWQYKELPLANYMMWIGEPTDKGLFAKAAQYVIYKRGGFGDWSQFAEMFGMPFREMIYDDYDDATRADIERGLQEWGTAGYSIHPRSTELKIHETGGSTGSNDVYDALVKACDASISKVILGNTLTTEQGDTGARSLGEVHQDVEEAKNQSDRNLILSVLNTQFRSILKRFGINAAGGFFCFKEYAKDWNSLQSKWNVINSIADRVPVDDDFIYEEFDIPKPENYDELKEEMRIQHGFNPFETQLKNPLNNEKGNDTPKNKRETRLLNRLKNFFV